MPINYFLESSSGFYFIAKRYFKRKVNCEGFVAHQKPINKTVFIVYLIIAISSFVLYFTGPKGRHDKVDEKFETINLEGFQKSIVNANIIKLENDSVLVYIKPPVGFFGGPIIPQQFAGVEADMLLKIKRKH